MSVAGGSGSGVTAGSGTPMGAGVQGGPAGISGAGPVPGGMGGSAAGIGGPGVAGVGAAAGVGGPGASGGGGAGGIIGPAGVGGPGGVGGAGAIGGIGGAGGRAGLGGGLGGAGGLTGIGGLGGSMGPAGSGGLAGIGGTGGPPPPPAFPATPITDTGLPPQVPGVFGQPDVPGAGPCLVAPEIHGPGAMYPTNWLPPRFRFQRPGGHDVTEIRLRTASQPNDLLVYTQANDWTLPDPIWRGLVASAAGGAPVEVSLRGADSGGGAPRLGSVGTIWIAPVTADGSIVYWDLERGDTLLRGFKAGTQPVRDVVRHSQIPGSRCIGCHSSTPDGLHIAFSASTSPTSGDPAGIEFATAAGLVGPPPFMTPAARGLTQRAEQHMPDFSPAHWVPGDRIMVTTFRPGRPPTPRDIIWTDLEAASDAQGQGWGVIRRGGDGGEPAMPDMSSDGTWIVYASGSDVWSGATIGFGGNLHIVPYNNRQGGMALPIAGASDPDFNECMPRFSPDGRLVAFSRVPGNVRCHDRPDGEVLVVSATGGAALRLHANDPPQCTGKTSPGVYNSWPQWSPQAKSAAGRTYYWVAFSSVRLTNNVQLFSRHWSRRTGC